MTGDTNLSGDGIVFAGPGRAAAGAGGAAAASGGAAAARQIGSHNRACCSDRRTCGAREQFDVGQGLWRARSRGRDRGNHPAPRGRYQPRDSRLHRRSGGDLRCGGPVVRRLSGIAQDQRWRPHQAGRLVPGRPRKRDRHTRDGPLPRPPRPGRTNKTLRVGRMRSIVWPGLRRRVHPWQSDHPARANREGCVNDRNHSRLQADITALDPGRASANLIVEIKREREVKAALTELRAQAGRSSRRLN